MYALWSKILLELYPALNAQIHPSLGAPVVLNNNNKPFRKIRLGIISETGSNSSPLLCLYPILEKILLLENKVSGSFDSEFELFYFPREEERQARYYYESKIRNLSLQVTFLSSFNLNV